MLNNRLLGVLLAFFVLPVLSTQAQLQQIWNTGFQGSVVPSVVEPNVNATFSGVPTTAGGTHEWAVNNVYAGGTFTFGTVNYTAPTVPAQPATITSPNQQYLYITSNPGVTAGVSNAHVIEGQNTGDFHAAVIKTTINTQTTGNVRLRFWLLNPNGHELKVYFKTTTATSWSQLNAGNFNVNPTSTINAWTQLTYSGSQLSGIGTTGDNIQLAFTYKVPSGAAAQTSVAIDDVELLAPPAPQATITGPNPWPTVVCPGESLTFTADNSNSFITTYKWIMQAGSSAPNTVFGTSTNLVVPNTPGTFSVTLEVNDGLITDAVSNTFMVDTCTPPNFNFSGTPTTVCVNKYVQFEDNSTPGYATAPIIGRYWEFPASGATPSVATNPLVQFNAAGTFDVILRLEDKNGYHYDTLENYINVIQCPVPIANFAASDTVLCPKGDNCTNFFDQSANMAAPGAAWKWEFPGADTTSSTLQNPQNICYSTPGKYSVKLTAINAYGQDSLTRLLYITVDSCLAPTVGFKVEAQDICRTTCIDFTTSTIRADSLVWVIENGKNLPNDTIINKREFRKCYTRVGNYNVQQTAYNEYGEDIILEKEYVRVHPNPNIEVPEDQEVIVGQSVKLKAFGSAPFFTWTPEYEMECSDCQEVTVTPREHTKYYATNYDRYGCKAIDSVIVRVRKDFFAGVPDAFSPNGDGRNDVLHLLGNGIQVLEFYVYDRFGQKVFESRDVKNGWDGYFKGKEVNPGVFVYFAKITYQNGYQEILKGDVTLVR